LDLSFAATGGGALEKDFEASGVPSFRLQRRLPLDPALILKLRKIIKREKIDVVHAHQAVEALHALFAAQGNRRAARFNVSRLYSERQKSPRAALSDPAHGGKRFGQRRVF
jgi:hypothetical protein